MTLAISLKLPDRALLTVKDVAAALSVHPNTVRRMLSGRRMGFVRVGRHVRVPHEALHAYLTDNTEMAWRAAYGAPSEDVIK
jgi:excisionase family DNA binding protein